MHVLQRLQKLTLWSVDGGQVFLQNFQKAKGDRQNEKKKKKNGTY